MQAGAVLQLPPGRSATLEVEVAVCFSRTVSPSDEAFDAASMIEYATVAVEVVCSRFQGRKSVGQPSFIADNVGFYALVCGDRLNHCDSTSFDDDAGLWRDGEQIATSLTGSDRTKPFLSLGFLWEKFAKQGDKIVEGSIVTTGRGDRTFRVKSGGLFPKTVANQGVATSLVVRKGEKDRALLQAAPRLITATFRTKGTITPSCVIVRSGQDPIVINLDIEPAEPPEEVYWVDPIHPHP